MRLSYIHFCLSGRRPSNKRSIHPDFLRIPCQTLHPQSRVPWTIFNCSTGHVPVTGRNLLFCARSRIVRPRRYPVPLQSIIAIAQPVLGGTSRLFACSRIIWPRRNSPAEQPRFMTAQLVPVGGLRGGRRPGCMTGGGLCGTRARRRSSCRRRIRWSRRGGIGVAEVLTRVLGPSIDCKGTVLGLGAGSLTGVRLADAAGAMPAVLRPDPSDWETIVGM